MSLTFRHVIVFTTLVHIAFIAIVCGGPTKEISLTDSIMKNKCMNFPPAALKIPSRCSEVALSSRVEKDLLNKDGLEFYLCAALLDSTNRFCRLIKNKEFGERLEKELAVAVPRIMSVSDDDKFCAEMNYLDPNTTMEQAKFLYEKLMEKAEYCALICGISKDESSAESQPLCKSIQFAHQQIRIAVDLQKSLNDQAHKSMGIRGPVEPRPANRGGGNTHDESDTLNDRPAAQLDLKDSIPRPVEQAQVSREESKTTETKPANENQLSQSASAQTKGDLRSSKPEVIKAQTTPPKTNPLRPIAPAPLQLVADGKSDVAQTKPQKPADEPDLEERTEGGDNIEARHGDPTLENIDDTQGDPPVDIQNDPQQEIQNGGQLPDNTDEDNVEKQEDDGNDEDNAMNGAQESNKDVAEKPPAVEKKASNINELPQMSHQKVSLELGRTSSQFGNLEEAEESHFFAYFLTMSALCTLGYLVYHNKRKIIAMAVEGKKGRNAGRRRPNSASYHKLDSNLEEAMSSNLTSTNSYVIY